MRRKGKIGKKLHTLWLVVISLAIIIAFVGVTQKDTMLTQLDNWKLLPQTDCLSELYFTNYTNAPARLVPEAIQTIDFTVANQQCQTTKYTYVITHEGATSQQLAHGALTLDLGESRSIQAPIHLPANAAGSIRVTLTFTGPVRSKAPSTPHTQFITYQLAPRAVL